MPGVHRQLPRLKRTAGEVEQAKTEGPVQLFQSWGEALDGACPFGAPCRRGGLGAGCEARREPEARIGPGPQGAAGEAKAALMEMNIEEYRPRASRGTETLPE